MSRHRILSDLDPLSTVIQGGAVGGWGPVAEANTAESFGTTFNLWNIQPNEALHWFSVDFACFPLSSCGYFTRNIQHDWFSIVSHLDLRFLQVFWFRVTGATGPTATSTPCTDPCLKFNSHRFSNSDTSNGIHAPCVTCYYHIFEASCFAQRAFKIKFIKCLKISPWSD